jgi:LacI family transcriptional regulator, galactose operon repressor
VAASRVTLSDIAADAGVSRATVSLVLRNVPTVADETRKRVQRSMRKLGYVYNRAAASLRTQRSHAIGLIVSDITNPFFAEVIVAIEERLAAAGFVTLLGNTSEDTAKEERLIRTMREFPADGLLVCPIIREPHSWTAFSQPPVVTFARFLSGIDYAGVDNAAGAEMAVRHLYAVGHRRIAFLGGDPERSTGRERLIGYQQAHRALGLSEDATLICPATPNRAGGHDALLRALDLPAPPTAALCFNDVVALGAIEVLHQVGKRPGPDFGIVGFNNIADARLTRPGLTTVDTSPSRIGETAADLLIQRITQPETPVRKVILQPRLIVRESCGGSGMGIPAHVHGQDGRDTEFMGEDAHAT